MKRRSIPNFPRIFMDSQILDLILIDKNHSSSINFQKKNFRRRETNSDRKFIIKNRRIIYLELCQIFCRAVKTTRYTGWNLGWKGVVVTAIITGVLEIYLAARTDCELCKATVTVASCETE